jgi:acyl carrier protein|tara:strand:- start:488 stop:706 length:219 start_codon:yes stop_codon:yes gene_type:complete
MKHINIISKSFNLDKKKIKKNDKVEKFNWDSMTKINLISNVDEKFSKILNHTKLEKIIFFKDIEDLIEKTIK